MVNIKKTVIFLTDTILLIAIFAIRFITMDPIVGTEFVADIHRYMDVNETVQKMLDRYSEGILPNITDKIPDGSVYKYEYSCALLGEPSCAIYLQCEYSKDIFDTKKTHIEENAVCIYSLNEDSTLYSYNESFEKNFDCYMDDIVEDGRGLVFEFAIIDESTKCIQYIFLVQQDGQSRMECTIDIFDQIKSINGTMFSNVRE